MDELKIGSAFLRDIIGKIVKKLVKKKTGIDLELLLTGLQITQKDGKIFAQVNAACEIKSEDIAKLLKETGVM